MARQLMSERQAGPYTTMRITRFARRKATLPVRRGIRSRWSILFRSPRWTRQAVVSKRFKPRVHRPAASYWTPTRSPNPATFRWSTNSYDDEGKLEHSRVYHTIPSSGTGSSGTNYDQTDFGYDSMDRQNMVTSPGGTITRTVFSSVGWDHVPTKIYIGTDDTAATESDPTGGGATGNNMVLVTESEYDSGNDGGDGLLTKQTDHVDSSTKTRNQLHLRLARSPNRRRRRRRRLPKSRSTISTTSPVSTVTTPLVNGNLIARSETKYDDLGRVYQTKRYAVDCYRPNCHRTFCRIMAVGISGSAGVVLPNC